MQVFDFKARDWIKLMVNLRTECLELHAMTLAMYSISNMKLIQDLTVPVPKHRMRCNEGIYIFGGRDEKGKPTSKLWRYRIFNQPWLLEDIDPNGKGPCARFGHGLCYLTSLHALVVFGGQDERGHTFGDLFLFSLHLGNWIEVKFGSRYKPQPRSMFGCATISEGRSSKMYVLGGINNGTYVGGVVECLDFDSSLYTKVAYEGKDNSITNLSAEKEEVMINTNAVYFDKKKKHVKETLRRFKPDFNYMPFPVEALESKIRD